MAVARKKGPKKPEPLLGSQAFGHDDRGRSTGAAAFGAGDAVLPQRGAQFFGAALPGRPTGAAALGGEDEAHPLRGARVAGNLASTDPTGAEAFGGAEGKAPLKGALRFGNDPAGGPTGALAFGNPTGVAQLLGAQAFGAPQLVPDKLYKDEIGYDFGATLLVADAASLAGIRKDPRDRLRQRIVAVLRRLLEMEVERLRQGLDENAIKWGRLRNPDCGLDRELAEELRRWYRKAPGDRLGIGHLAQLLEESERMHSFTLLCAWDKSPVTLSVMWGNEAVAQIETRQHKQTTFFEVKDLEGITLAYADTLVPGRGRQEARVRGVDGAVVGTLALELGRISEAADVEEPKGKAPKLCAAVRGPRDKPWFDVEEQQANPKLFVAELKHCVSGDPVGRIEDRHGEGAMKVSIELDLPAPQVMVWSLGAIMADLSRRARAGWPDVKVETEEAVPSVAEALGPRRRRVRAGSEGAVEAGEGPSPRAEGTPEPGDAAEKGAEADGDGANGEER